MVLTFNPAHLFNTTLYLAFGSGPAVPDPDQISVDTGSGCRTIIFFVHYQFRLSLFVEYILFKINCEEQKWLDWRIFHFCLQDTYYTVHTLFDEFSHFTVLSSLMHLSMAFFRIYKKVLWLWLLTIKHKELCSTKLSKQKDREVLSVMYYI